MFVCGFLLGNIQYTALWYCLGFFFVSVSLLQQVRALNNFDLSFFFLLFHLFCGVLLYFNHTFGNIEFLVCDLFPLRVSFVFLFLLLYK